MSLDTLVVVPAFGLPWLTRATVGRLLPEQVDLLVVDNLGDYAAIGRERVARPGRNLRWLGACNLGLEHAAARGYAYALLLNNDVHTSPNFAEGLVLAARDLPGRRPVAIAGPMESGEMGNGQHLDADPDAYDAEPVDFDVKFVHGVCMLVSMRAYACLGPLDVAQLPHGWGTDVEHGMLARRAGYRCVATRRSYLRHDSAATVAAHGDPLSRAEAAKAHVRRVFRARYGLRWPQVLDFDYGIAP